MSFPISEHGYTSGRLFDGIECQLLLEPWMQVSPSCQNHSTCNASHSTHCQICLKDSKNTSRKWSMC